MGDIFRRVEPDRVNADTTYGHEIRNLLALACMEVESSWRAVLKANHYVPAHAKTGSAARYTTSDYVKLGGPLRPGEYAVQLSGHPNIDSFAPFAGWDAAKPTESLPWYDAYNETKHDREANFRSATLLRMIQALGASHVMMHAQFGHCAGVGVGSIDRDDFYVVRKPMWPLEERYIPPAVLKERGEPWRDIDLPLTQRLDQLLDRVVNQILSVPGEFLNPHCSGRFDQFRFDADLVQPTEGSATVALARERIDRSASDEEVEITM